MRKELASRRFRTPLKVRVAGVMVAGIGVMAAFGCTPAADTGSASNEGADVQPASAVIAMEYENGSDMFDHKSVEVTDASLIGEGAQFVNGLDAENTYIYKGYAHGDNNHYSMYSLYTELITDGNGILTGINLTSAADTWANKWGATGARPTFSDMLPEGASFECSETQQGGNTVLSFSMDVEEGTEAAAAGYGISNIYLYNVQDDGTTAGSDETGRGGRVTHNDYDAAITVESAADDDDDDERDAGSEGGDRGGKSGSGEARGNGSSDADGNGHADGGAAAADRGDRSERSGGDSGERSGAEGGKAAGSAAAAETAAAEPAGYSFDEADDTLTIEDGAYNLVQVRYRFGTEVYFDEYIVIGESEAADAYVAEHAESADLEAPEKTEGTAVTNRTKWTYSMLSMIAQRELESWASTFEDPSLYTGGNDGEIGDIDTISGATKTSVPFQSALNQAIEAGYVTGIGDNVRVTIDGGDPAADGIDVSAVQQDQTTVTVDENGNYVVSMNFPAGIDESANGELQHAIAPTKVDVYALGGQDLGTLGVWNLGKGTAGLTPLATYEDANAAPGDTADEHVIYVSDWEYPYNPTLTVLDPSITHVVVSYSIGHETLGIAYDLAAMAQAYQVQAMIEDLDGSDAQAVAAARAAYDGLTNDVKGTVSNYGKLLEAEGK